ncbi:MAG TPA: hypothetical protein VF069_12400 [Streptosporangiaceae bacterium]
MRRADALDPQRSNDELIAFTLIRTWALISGRSLRRDVALDQLSEDELIDFWADSLTSGEDAGAAETGPH